MTSAKELPSRREEAEDPDPESEYDRMKRLMRGFLKVPKEAIREDKRGTGRPRRW